MHGRVPVKAVIAKANELSAALLAEMRKESVYALADHQQGVVRSLAARLRRVRPPSDVAL